MSTTLIFKPLNSIQSFNQTAGVFCVGSSVKIPGIFWVATKKTKQPPKTLGHQTQRLSWYKKHMMAAKSNKLMENFRKYEKKHPQSLT